MLRQIHVCDRCKKEAESKEDVEALALHRVILGTDQSYSSYGGTPSIFQIHPRWYQQWCLACRKETGLAVVMEQRHNTPAAQVPSLEDMIREIVRQEISEAPRS